MKSRYHPGHRSREHVPSGPHSPWALSSPTGWLCGGAPGSPRGPDSRRFDRDIFDLDAADPARSPGSAVSSLSPDGPEERSGGSGTSAGLLVVDVLASSDQPVEEVILAPNVHKLPESALVKVSLQSNSEKVTMYCSSDILKMKSPFFGTVLTEQEQRRGREHDSRSHSPPGPTHVQDMWRSPIVLAESYPYEAAALLESIHENYLLSALSWNSTFCRLSVVWALDEFVDNFALLIDTHIDACIHSVKSFNWRTNARLLVDMDVAVFCSELGGDPVLFTGKVVAPDGRIDYSCIRCVLDASDLIDSPNRPFLASPVFTDAELRTCASMSPTSEGAAATPATLDQRTLLPEPLMVAVKEPFWVMGADTGGKWLSPDEFCLSSRKFEIPQGDKRKFWEMMKLLHELPLLNKRCKNRMKTAEQLAQLFKRTEFRALWSAEAADCLTTDALMCLLSALFGV